MSKLSIKNNKLALDILESYSDSNPYIKMIKNSVLIKKTQVASDFELNYILKNYEFQSIEINKIVKITEEFGEKKAADWKYDHKVNKLQVVTLLGETDNHYHCNVNYKHNQVKPIMCFIPKKDLLDDLFIEDFEKLEVDFSEFNKVLALEDKELYEHQKTAVKFLRSRKRCILADDMGLGKSLSSIVASISGDFKKVLIICPASLKGVRGWQKQLQTFISEDDICVIDGDNWISNKRYTIINYDIIDRHHIVPKENGKISRKKTIVDIALAKSNFLKENFDLVIIDEVHKISKDTSIRYESIYDYLKRSNLENIWLLTGTIITKSPINYMNILKLIFHPVTDQWQSFIERYCDGHQICRKGEKERLTNMFLDSKRKNSWFDLTFKEKDDLVDYIDKYAKKLWITSGNSNLEELFEKTKNVYLRRLKDMIPGMMGKEIHEVYYDLSPEQEIEYSQLWNEYETSQRELGKTEFNQDLTEGILMRMAISRYMIENTKKLADSFILKGEKVLIACAFNDEIFELQKYFGKKCVIYKGGMTQKKKDEAERKFMEDPEIMVFLGNIESAGVGLTLISSHICLFNSYSWIPANNSQIQDRVVRIGQKHLCHIYYQLFRNTISEDMWENVIKKEIVINTIVKKEEDK